MGPAFQRAFLQCVIGVAIAVGTSVAQSSAEKALPDAPLPTASAEATSITPSTAHTEPQQRPAFSVGMTRRQKYALAYNRIVSPQMPLKAVFVSGWELGTGTGPDIPTNGWGPFAERVGYNAAGISTTIFFNTAFVPALVHQDPRYFPLGEGSVKGRVGWALKSEFVGVGDDGHTMPNYANIVGLGLSSIAIDAFSPRDSSGYGDTLERYAIKLGVGAGINVVREFDLFGRIKLIARHSRSAGE